MVSTRCTRPAARTLRRSLPAGMSTSRPLPPPGFTRLRTSSRSWPQSSSGAGFLVQPRRVSRPAATMRRRQRQSATFPMDQLRRHQAPLSMDSRNCRTSDGNQQNFRIRVLDDRYRRYQEWHDLLKPSDFDKPIHIVGISIERANQSNIPPVATSPIIELEAGMPQPLGSANR